MRELQDIIKISQPDKTTYRGKITEFRCSLDPERTNAIANYIKDNIKGKTLVDCGTGGGLFSWLGYKYGAKHIIALDQISESVDAVKELVPGVEAHHCDLFYDDLPKGEDYIYVHELFGHVVWDEYCFKFFDNLQRQGIDFNNVIPHKIDFYYEYIKADPKFAKKEIVYDKSWYNDDVVEYHTDYYNKIEDWTTQQLTMMNHMPFARGDRSEVFWTYDLTTKPYDKVNYCPQLENMTDIYKIPDPYNNVAWRVWMGEYYYENTSRKMCNWMPWQMCLQDNFKHKVSRIKGYLKDYYKNPYQEDECKFLS